MRKEPTIDDKLAAVKAKFPLAQFPSDFGSNPADATALDRLASPLPAWAQKAGAKVNEFFGGDVPQSDQVMSRVGSMRSAGGKSISDAQYQAALGAGRLLIDHVVPGGAASRTGQAFTKANQLYNAEVKGVQMSARGAVSAQSMFSDIADMSGFMPTPTGGYASSGDINKEVVGEIYMEAAARGLDPVIVAQERLPYAMLETNNRGREFLNQQAQYNRPIWQNDDGSTMTARDVEEGPNKASKVMRYVPKFMETSQNQA
jgi:hypothetical protein